MSWGVKPYKGRGKFFLKSDKMCGSLEKLTDRTTGINKKMTEVRILRREKKREIYRKTDTNRSREKDTYIRTYCNR